MSNSQSLPNLDFSDMSASPQNLGTDSQPYISLPTNEIDSEPGVTVQRSPSVGAISSFSDSRKKAVDESVKQISSSLSDAPSHAYHGFTQYCRHWRLESIASVFILACPIIIATTLYPHAGQPIPQWPFRISINTLLSIYSLVLKTCLTFVVASCIGQLQWSWFSCDRPLYDLVRFDRATRGPWGSIQLLCSENIRHPLTALGAALLIGAIAIDPFVQQLVSPYDCSVRLLTQNATLPRTNMLDLMHDGTSPHAAVYSTVYTPSNLLSWQCSTGNCTFSQPYGSLAYCNSCEDWSDKLLIKTDCQDPSVNYTTPPKTEDCSSGEHVLYSYITTSFYIGDLGIHSQSNEGFFTSDWINVTMSISDDMALAKTIHWYDGTQFKPGFEKAIVLMPKTIVSDMQTDVSTGAPWTDCNTTAASNSWHCRGYGVAVCEMQPCVRTYNATVTAGQLEERVISNSGSSAWVVNPYTEIGMLDTHCVSDAEKGALVQKGYQFDDSSQWLGYNASASWEHEDDELVSSLLSHNCLYLMQNLFNGTFPDWGHLVGKNLWGDLTPTGGMVVNGTWQATGLSGPSMLSDLYNGSRVDFENVQETFANLSDIMTDWLRTHGNSTYAGPAIGDVLHYATCLRVQWPWIAFPATLAALALVFFVAVVMVTSRQKVPVWKSSLLPWIMRGPNSGFLNKSGAGTSDMDQSSKDIFATLVNGPDPRIELVQKDEGISDTADGASQTRA